MAAGTNAELLYDYKNVLARGFILQMQIWRVPQPVAGSRHPFKYRLFLGRSGERAVLYDNERGKGDHRHYGDREERYRFRDVDTLLRDFLADVERVCGEDPATGEKR